MRGGEFFSHARPGDDGQVRLLSRSPPILALRRNDLSTVAVMPHVLASPLLPDQRRAPRVPDAGRVVKEEPDYYGNADYWGSMGAFWGLLAGSGSSGQEGQPAGQITGQGVTSHDGSTHQMGRPAD